MIDIFLKVCHNVKFQVITTKFLYSVTLKPIGPPCTFHRSFPHTQCYKITYWQFRNIGSLNYTDVPNVHTFCCIISKSRVLISPLISPISTPEEFSKTQKLSCSQWWIQVLQNFHFLLVTSSFIIDNSLLFCSVLFL